MNKLNAEWFVEFDKESIETKMQNVNFALFAPAEREIGPNDLNRVGLSNIEFEAALMKHFCSQLNIMHNFLSTEAIANDDQSFQRYARKMLNYTKAEMSYCYTFWQNEKLLDYVIYRLDATLLRTYYFLLDLHKNVVRRKTLENRSYWNINESLEELAGYLALRMEDLVCLIQYFENAYEMLYNRVSQFSQIYPLEVNLVAAIWGVANMFMEYSYEEIRRSGIARFTPAEENKLKETVLISNKGFRVKKKEIAKNLNEVEKDAMNYLMAEAAKSRTLTHWGEEIIPNSSRSVMQQMSMEKEKSVKPESEEQSISSIARSNYLERLRESQKNPSIKKKLLDNKHTESSFDSNGLSSVSSMKFSTLSLSQLSSVKESPNNPLARSALMNNFISDMGEEHDLRIKIAKESKMITRQNIISHFNKDILYKNITSDDQNSRSMNQSNLNMSVETDQKRAMTGKNHEVNEYMKLVTSGLAEELYQSLVNDKTGGENEANEESEKNKKKPRGLFMNLKMINRQKTIIPVEVKEEKKKKKKKKKKKNAEEELDEDGQPKKKLSKKKQKEEEILKMAAETALIDQLNYQPSKENKGDDIPDEEALGNLIFDDEESIITEEDEEDEEEEDKKSGDNNDDDEENEDEEEEKDEEGSDKEDEEGSERSKESDEESPRKKKKKEKMLKELAAAQQNVSRNEFEKNFEELLQKEQKNLRSRYFLPGRNMLNLLDVDDINKSRHKSKWCFLQDNYQFQNVEKICNNIKNGEDYSFILDGPNFSNLLDRKTFRQKTKKMKRDLSKPFQFAKQNKLAVFQDIFGVVAVDLIPQEEEEEKSNGFPQFQIQPQPQVQFIGLPQNQGKIQPRSQPLARRRTTVMGGLNNIV